MRNALGGSKKAQNSAIRYICNVKYREHITPFYIKLSMLKIKERHDMHSLVMTFKILKNYAPGYLSKLFTPGARQGPVSCTRA